jgi:hypothetical protein
MSAKTLVRIDAVFEAALGLALLVGFDGGDFPSPVGRVVVVTVGCLLLALAVVLWLGIVGPAALALGNAVTAGAAVAWLLAVSGFSSAGAALVAVTAGALVFLAIRQAAALRT